MSEVNPGSSEDIIESSTDASAEDAAPENSP
jgi:hypothetical protein